MKLAHVVPSLEARYGGPSRSVLALSAALARLGHTTEILTTDPIRSASHHEGPLHVRTFRRGWPGRLCPSRDLRDALATVSPEIVHHHALWLRTLHYAHQTAQRASVPLVISPRGMMSGWAWRHHDWRKKFARSFSWENTAIKTLNAIQSLIQSPKKTLKSCCLIRLWPILQPSDNNLVLETIKQLQNEFTVQHFVSESEIYFDAEVGNQSAIHPIETLGTYLREDPAMVLICWPRSQDELDLIKGFEWEEKYIVIDEVNKKLFCSGSDFENRNELAYENLRDFKKVIKMPFDGVQ
jgi:hypothetical protein